MFYSSRVVDVPDGKPKWTGMNGSSDLIEDSPPELVKKRKHEQMEEEEDKAKESKEGNDGET